MSATAPLADLDVDRVENVFVFVADALRWDALPDVVADMGRTHRAAANALCTPQSLPTLVTGRYAPRHGVTWFSHTVEPSLDTLFDVEGTSGGFVEEEWDRPLDGVLGGPPDRGLDDVEPPFVLLEHDHGGHAPYPEMPDATPAETYSELAGDREAVRRHYEEGVAESVDRFQARLDALEERGLLEETLVVFTSDHGELLGEHGGFVGHMLPPTPELVYVPMTFVHPSLDPSVHRDGLVQLADLLPTTRDVLGKLPDGADRAYDGQSLLNPVSRDRMGYVHGTVHPPAKWRDTRLDPAWQAPSVWTRGGGYVFQESPPVKRLLTAVYDGLSSGYTAAFNDHRSPLATLVMALRQYAPRERTYGSPEVPLPAARQFCRRQRQRTVERRTVELEEETRQKLEDLGYV
jgi:arylsulfatase A-like enzyme